jgi:hypothetical protein
VARDDELPMASASVIAVSLVVIVSLAPQGRYGLFSAKYS